MAARRVAYAEVVGRRKRAEQAATVVERVERRESFTQSNRTFAISRRNESQIPAAEYPVLESSHRYLKAKNWWRRLTMLEDGERRGDEPRHVGYASYVRSPGSKNSYPCNDDKDEVHCKIGGIQNLRSPYT